MPQQEQDQRQDERQRKPWSAPTLSRLELSATRSGLPAEVEYDLMPTPYGDDHFGPLS